VHLVVVQVDAVRQVDAVGQVDAVRQVDAVGQVRVVVVPLPCVWWWCTCADCCLNLNYSCSQVLCIIHSSFLYLLLPAPVSM
jgi:hypothetical protein